jgi:hypothetical protein
MAFQSGRQEPSPGDVVQSPAVLRLAGWLAIFSACLLFLNVGATLLLVGATFGGGSGGNTVVAGAPLNGITGLVSLLLGIRIVRGKPANFWVHGVLFFALALLNCGFGILIVTGVHTGGEPPYDGFWYRHESSKIWAMSLGGVSVLAGFGLLIAGALALLGWKKCQEW